MLDFDDVIEIPDLVLGEKSDEPAYKVEPDAKNLAVKFGIIGSGQGGNRLANQFYKSGYRRVCIINTTPQDFTGLEVPEQNRLIVGNNSYGAGKDPDKGAEALKGSAEEVLNLMRHSFGEDIDRIMVTSGCGGGTGTGTLPGLASLAKTYLRKLGKPEKVGIIASLPKKTEGGKVQANAYAVLKELLRKKHDISPIVLVDNDSIHKMFPEVSAKSFWDIANKNLVGLFDIFNILACQRSAYVTFDKADYESMLDAGQIVFGATKLSEYKKDTDISDALRKNLKSTLLADPDLTKSTHMAAILCASDSILGVLPQSHIDRAFETMERLLGGEGRDLVIHQGVYETSQSSLFLYTMVGGIHIPEERLNIMKARST